MPAQDPADDGPLLRFVRLYAEDRQAGRVRTLGEYLERCPGADAAVAECFAALEFSAFAPAATSSERTHDDGRFGPYRVVRELGRGGQGVVYLADDERLSRKVALKVLAGSGAWFEAALTRFRREAELVSRLDHPGICVVYDAGFAGRAAYIAMRYVEGETLARRIAKADEGGAPPGAADVDLATRVVESAARALHAAHEAGVVHRDFKPGNVMVTPAGDAVVLDFGLAQDVSGSALTASGEGLGTPAYMAPEQIRPGAAPPDRRVDVYALGAALFEAATRRRPFEGPNRDALFRSVLEEDAPDPAQWNRAVPRDLAVVIATAMAKDPRVRYPTAAALAEDLRRVRAREPVLARPASRATRLLRWAQRNPATAASVGAAFALLLAAAGLAVAWARDADGRAEDLRAEREAGVPVQYAAALAAAEAAHRAGDDAAARRFLDAAPTGPRGFEWRRLRWVADRSAATFAVVPGKPRFAAAANGGAALVALGDDGVLRAVDAADGRPIAATRLDAGADRVAVAEACFSTAVASPLRALDARTGAELWQRTDGLAADALGVSRDGGVVAAYDARDGTLRFLDGRTGATLRERRGLPGPVELLTFSRDGARCLASGERGTRMLDVATGDDVWTANHAYVRFCGDGTTAYGGGRPFRVDPATGAGLWSDPLQLGLPGLVAAGDDGDSVFFAASAGVERFDAATGARVATLSSLDAPLVALVDLPARGAVAAVDAHGTARLFDRRLGPEPRTAPLHDETAFVAAATVDGARVFAAGWGVVRALDGRTGELLLATYAYEDFVQALAPTPDGAAAAVGGRAGRVVLLDGATGRVRARSAALPAPITALRWSRDARTLYVGDAAGGVAELEADLRVRATRRVHGSPVLCLATTPDGAALLSGAGEGASFVGAGTPLPAGAGDATATLRRVADGATLATFDAAPGGVRTASFLERGGRVVLGTGDGFALLCDVATGREIARRRIAPRAVASSAASADGTRIAFGCEDGSVRVVDAALARDAVRYAAPALSPAAVWWADDALRAAGGGVGLASFETGPPAEGFAAVDLAARAAHAAASAFVAGDLVADDRRARLAERRPADAVRAAAERRVAVAGDHPWRLNSDAWGIVLGADREAEAYARAARVAEAAVRAAPDNWAVRNTLGLALVRAGRAAAAVEAIAAGESLRAAAGGPRHAGDAAVRALAFVAAGDLASAAAECEAARRAAGADDPDVARLLREAEAALGRR